MEKLLIFFTISFILASIATARDPDILTDFVVPPHLDYESITGDFFTYTGLRSLGRANITRSTPTLRSNITMRTFPALHGQGLSGSLIVFPPTNINMPHINPRATELMFLITGSLSVAFVDTDNKLYTQTLKPWDLFIFPKGLMHSQANTHGKEAAVAWSMFGSGEAGRMSVPGVLFGSGIDAKVLAKALNTDEDTVAKMVLAHKS